MAHLALQPHVGYGLVDARAVFLDLRRDRYLALDHACEQAFRRLLAPEAPAPTAGSAAARRLLATGLFREASSASDLRAAAVPRPPASLLDEGPPAVPAWTAVPRAWLSVARARNRLRSTSLLDIVAGIRADRAAMASPIDGAEDTARAFLAARALVPIERSCLLDALALLDWLGDSAGTITLVFGVRLNPFRAHCWVQTDRLLLTDASDAVDALVPVLAV